MFQYLSTDEGNPNWWLIFSLLFAFPLLKWIMCISYELFKQIIPPTNILAKYCRTDVQSWAVVTGATDGIGLGFCEVLVDQGFNIVLISRNPEKLEKTVEDLKARNKKKQVKIKTITFNFKDSADPVKYGSLIEELKTIDIGLFINNVGTSDGKFYHKFSYEQIVDIININCTGMALLSSDILRMMNQRSHKSALINLSSYMQESPLPFLALYSATKAFNKNLTQSLYYQYPDIDVMCLKPMFVQTPLSKQKKGLTIPDRRQCAQDSLRQLRWQHQSYGHISHRLVASIMKHLIPSWFQELAIKHFSQRFIKKTFPKIKKE